MQSSSTSIPVFGIIEPLTDEPFTSPEILRDVLSLVVVPLSINSLKIPGPGEVNLGRAKYFVTTSGINHIIW